MLESPTMSGLPPPLEPYITVQDAVHGRIWLTKLEAELVATPQFQRLRHISQLGLAPYAFPTATHTRFAHSLGATHVMGLILREQPLQDYFEGREPMISILRAAALLHDIGHYPFSHLGENVWPVAERGVQAYGDTSTEITVFDIAAELVRPPGASDTSHEALTTRLIRETEIAEIIDSHLGDVDGQAASEQVALIVDGRSTDLVCRSLLSSDLDCDRLDYLVRDSLAAGLIYGQVDLSYLVENLLVAEHKTFGAVLAVDKDHGTRAVEHYLVARYYHYAQFITHKTIVSAELLLAAAILELIRHERLPDATTIQADLLSSRFLALTEARVWSRLHEAYDSGVSPELTEIARRLIERDLLKVALDRVGLEERKSSSDEGPTPHWLDELLDTPTLKQAFAAEEGLDPSLFCFKRSSLPLVGVYARLAPKEEIAEAEMRAWAKTVKVAEPGGEPMPLFEIEGPVHDLSNRSWVTRRVFVREEPRVLKTARRHVSAVREALERREP